MTPQWFGEYEIIKRLRVGGMATLYLARRHGAAGFARLVALKMIHAHLVEQPTFIEMFVDEARICSQISHPNVVHVEEFGVIDGVHYLVMEYLDGCSIGELLVVNHRERKQLDPELAARITMQVAAGLHAAHEARDGDGQRLEVVHRDISPSNILLSTDGNPKLIDFGIAKARNRLAETAAGITLKGKYNYVAPEQASRIAVDRRCDIFSLGVVFWEMLVGKPLFPEDTHVALFNRMARTDVVAPSTLHPAVPAALDSIVLAMLQHDPEDRPQTAAEVQRRIATAIPGAANRDPGELAALAADVRDKRAARLAIVEPASFEGRAGFSSVPRSTRSPSELRVAAGDTSVSFVVAPARPGSAPLVEPGSQPGGTPPPAPGFRPGLAELSRPGSQAGLTPPPTRVTPPADATPRRWSRRVQISLAGLLALGVIVGVLLAAHRDRLEADASAARANRPLDPPRGHAMGSDRVDAVPPMPSMSSGRGTAPPPPPIVHPPAELAAPASAAPAPVVQARATLKPPPTTTTIRRERPRVVVNPRPPRPAATEAERPHAAEPRAPGGPRSPFSGVRFDDAGNVSPAPTPPIAGNPRPATTPDFEN